MKILQRCVLRHFVPLFFLAILVLPVTELFLRAFFEKSALHLIGIKA